MALNSDGRIAVFATVGEAWRLTWENRVPYLVLTLLFVLPTQAIAAFGLFEPLETFNKQAQADPQNISLAEFPLGATLLALTVGFAVLSGFGILWYRYLLLGRGTALRLGLAQFGGMAWRFTAYGLLVWTICVVGLVVISTVACLLGGIVATAFGLEGIGQVAIMGGYLGATYFVLLPMLVRTFLVFPALAVGQPTSLGEAWTTGKESADRLFLALLAAALGAGLLSGVVHGVLSPLLSIDLLTQSALAAEGWWLRILLSPISNLGTAVMIGVMAISYRDLTGAAPAPVAQEAASYAP